MTYVVDKAPHLRSKRHTRFMMLELTACLFALFLYAMVYYYVKWGTQYGNQTLFILLISLGAAILGDALWSLHFFWDKNIKTVGGKFAKFGNNILDSYGYVSGFIFALLMPVGTPLYVVFVGSFLGTFLCKSLFGGFGKNIFNPAIAGRVLVQAAFGSSLKSYLGTEPPTTIATGATIVSISSEAGWTTNEIGISLFDCFMGNYRGAIGETFCFLIIILAIYLSIRKTIDWRLSVSYCLTFLVSVFFMGLFAGMGVHAFEFAARQIMVGGVLFGALFCITDPVTSPTSRVGKIIYGCLAAFITVLIRYKASATEGVAYSILIVNMFTPLIDHFINDRSNEHTGLKCAVIGTVMVLSAITGSLYGAKNPTSDDYVSQGGGANVSHLNAILSAQSLANVDGSDVTVIDSADYPSLEDGTISLEYKGFTVSSKNACYVEAKTKGVDASEGELAGDNMTMSFGFVLTSDGIIGTSLLVSESLNAGDVELDEVMDAIKASTPYTATSTQFSDVAFTSATYTKNAAKALFDEILTGVSIA